jgi:hypothetical protein
MMRIKVTIWMHADRDTVGFAPVDDAVAKWTVVLPEGARLISDRNRGILVEEADGDLEGPSDVILFAAGRNFGYAVDDGWDPDHLLRRFREVIKH